MTDIVADGALTDQFPVPRSCPFHPQPEYAALQRERPVARVGLPSGIEAVLITRHADVRALLNDERLSADERRDGYPFLYDQGFESPLAGTFMRADGEAHQRVRRMLAKDFTVARAAQLRPAVEAIVGECLDAMAAHGPPADLMQALALPVPSRTICRVLGVPDEARVVVEDNAKAMIDVKSTPEQVGAAMQAVLAYLDGLITAKEGAASDDLISRLIVEELATGQLERQELVTICLILLVAGHETTATQIGLSVYALLEHPDQLALLRADPALWPRAVEELLRHQTIVQAPTQRAVVADVELAGETIRAGEGVLTVLTTANRDPAVFADPDRLDVTRENSHRHVAFSFGPHQCLGHALARMELDVVFETLFGRFPGLALAVPADAVPLRAQSINLFGVESLPVTW